MKEKDIKAEICHITGIENINSIFSDGLKANEQGEIYLFENVAFSSPFNRSGEWVADAIAKDQLALQRYVCFEIDKNGITADLQADNVGERSAKFQYIVKQPVILPKYLQIIGYYDVNSGLLTPKDLRKDLCKLWENKRETKN